MARGPLFFKQSDLTRAIKATLAAGLTVQKVSIDPNGAINLVTNADGDEKNNNEWDEVLHGDR
jgi:hypothetical protein